MQAKATREDYFRVKRESNKESVVHKVPCRHCGYYNNPVNLHKREHDKYYRCAVCGKELKSEKQDFADKLMSLMKGGDK